MICSGRVLREAQGCVGSGAVVVHRPVAANDLREPGGASLLTVKTGDEVTGLAFEFIAFPFCPLAGAPDELAVQGKGLMS